MHTRLQRGGILKLVAALTMAAILSLDGWTIPKPQELAGTKVAYAEEAQGEMLASQADELDDAESVADDQGQIEPEAAAPVEEAVTQEAPEEALGTQDDDPHVYLDQDNGIIYSDGNLTLTYDASEVPADDDTYFVDVELGVFRDDVNGSPGFDPDFTENENAYSFDADTNTIVLHGAWLYENYFKDHQDERLRVSVWLYHGTDDEGNPIQVHPSNPETGYYNVREAKIDYHPMWSGDMLPGWDGFIDKYNSAWVENTDNPDGMDVPYEVTNVEIITGEDSFTLEKQENGWYFRAEENLGSAVFEVTHTTIDDETTSYQFTRNVTGSVYDIEWDLVGNTSLEESHNGLGCGLPGDTIELLARGIHHHAEGEDTYDGFTYAWSFIEGDEYASIDVQQNSDGSSTASVTFNNYEGSDYYCGNVRLHVVASKNGNDVSSGDIWLDVENEYPSVWVQETGATTIEGDMLVGTTQEVTPEVRYYTQGSDGYTLGDIEGLTWDFDSNCVSMSYGDGVAVESGTRIEVGSSNVPTFTITRLGDWDSDINLSVDWRPNENQGTFAADGEGLRHEHARWRLNRSDVRLWFDGEHDIDVWVTESEGAFSNPANVTNSVELSEQLAAVEGVSVEWTVGTWEDGEYLETFGPESGLYSVSADGLSVTSNATAMAERGIRDLRVTATAKLGDAVVRESDNDFWFHLQTRICSYGFPNEANMLPGWVWGGWIPGEVDVFLLDEDHDHEHATATVTSVSVVNPSVANVRKEGDRWTLEALEHGETTAIIKFVDYDGQTKGWALPIVVSDKVYNVEVWTSPQSGVVLPGQSVEVYAKGWVECEDAPTIYEGLSYRWEPESGEDFTLTVDEADPTHATVTFRDLNENENPGWYYCEAWPNVVIYETDDQGNEIDRARAFTQVSARSSSYVLNSEEEIDPNLAVNGTATADPKVTRVFVNDAGEVVSEPLAADDLQFFWSYDPEAVRLTDASGAEVTNNNWGQNGNDVAAGDGPYTVTRLREYGTSLEVMARWSENGEEFSEWLQFMLLPVSPEAPKIDISQAAIAAIPAQTYTGRAIEPALTVTYDGATLVAGNDYTVTYRDNVNVGNKAKVTVTGTGDFTGTASATFRIGFKDVKKGAWYYNVVYRANDLGLIGGYSGPKEGTFGPNDNIQRGQVAIILWNLARKPAAGSGAKDFSDVKKGAYYYSAVRWASSVGVVSGGSDGTFRPTDDVTREELASMLRSYYVKVAGRAAVGSAADFASMPDASSVSSWARSGVGFCFRNRILSGKNGMIAPKATATRAETAKMVVFLYDMLNA